MSASNLYLLRGDDTYSIALRIKSIQSGLGVDFDETMNLIRLDGKTSSLEETQMAVSTLPFFGSSRLVILESALSAVDKSKQEKFIGMLESLPPSTRLVLTIEDHQKWRKDGSGWIRVWETLSVSHWLVKWFASHPQGVIIDLPLPEEKNMGKWIIEEVKRQGGTIAADAAQELSQHVGNDTSVASQEIAKLLMYVDFKRPLSHEDVLNLVSVEGSADVFAMLDLLMDGKTQQAQSMMHRLLDDSPPEAILGAVIHRFRQMIQVREALDAQEDLKVLTEKKVFFYNQINKYTVAARRFNLKRLEELYHRLLEMDVQSKTSQTDLATNLELLVMQINP